MKHYGLKLSIRKPEDYILGGAQVQLAPLQPDGDWTSFLPTKEVQNLNGIEPYACVSFTILNAVEILIKRKYGIDRNYSDRFLAAVSGTKDLMGNDPHAVCEYLRKVGVVMQDVWPFDSAIKTFEDFYGVVPPKLYELAKEFNNEWDFTHFYVNNDPESITKALQSSPLLISVPAWNLNSDGFYYRPEGMYDNHATTLIYQRIGAFRRVFDSYDAPLLKDLTWDTIPMQIKGFSITKKKKLSTGSLWSRFIAWRKIQVRLWNFLTPKNG